MATQAVSNLSIFQELQSFYQDRRTDLRQLGSALQAGDLNQAQQAFATLTALGQSGPFGNSEPFSRNDRAQAFEAVGQALQSGDLAGAQAAFANLQQTQGGRHDGAHLRPAFIVSLSTTQNAGANYAAAAESIYQQEREFRQQRRTDLEQLGQALQSGNADAAQQAYDALVTLGQNGPFRNSQPFQRADRAQDFAAIGQALQSGDLAGAQQAFIALAGTFGHHHQLPPGPPTPAPPPATPPPTTVPPQGTLPPGPPTPVPPPIVAPPTVPPGHQPPSTTGGPSGPPEIIINVGGTTAPSGSATEIVVNLPKPSSTPEEIQINFGDSHGSGGQLTIDVKQLSGGEQVALNFNPGSSNYQLVLNLFDTGSNSSPQSNSLSLQA
jgi:DNA-binding FadR family transcriptional regulator